MTPLAKEVAELKASNKAWWQPYASVLKPFPEVHCFEVTQIKPLVQDLSNQAEPKRRSLIDVLSFLPAPATWIERTESSEEGRFGRVAGRSGYLLLEADDKLSARVVEFMGINVKGGIGFVAFECSPIPLLGNSDPDNWAIETALRLKGLAETQGGFVGASRMELPPDDGYFLDQMLNKAYEIYLNLAIINSPHVIIRNTRPPSSGLQKRLARQAQNGESYQLLPWHDILLEVPAKFENASDPSGRIVGPRALHFVRQFVRIRMGKLELVRSHWRGDAAVGISQSRYVVGRPN